MIYAVLLQLKCCHNVCVFLPNPNAQSFRINKKMLIPTGCQVKRKVLSHRMQEYGFSPVWVFMWLFKVPARVKDCSQIEQRKDVLLEGVNLCIILKLNLKKYLTQTEEEHGFSPLWTILCRLSSLWQTEQAKSKKIFWSVNYCETPLYERLSETLDTCDSWSTMVFGVLTCLEKRLATITMGL